MLINLQLLTCSLHNACLQSPLVSMATASRATVHVQECHMWSDYIFKYLYIHMNVMLYIMIDSIQYACVCAELSVALELESVTQCLLVLNNYVHI